MVAGVGCGSCNRKGEKRKKSAEGRGRRRHKAATVVTEKRYLGGGSRLK
jgi:hypothetical protein